MPKILTQNGKLKSTSKKLGVKVYNFGIPAYKSVTGKMTCPMADSCVEFCYARKGAYTWGNVKPAYEWRLELTRRDDFVDLINKEIMSKREIDYVRIHDSGDFYSPKYLAKWVQIAKANPYVRFYAYTNMIALFKRTKLPSNFDVIFSDSGKQKHMIDKTIDRHTRIFMTPEGLTSSGYINASKIDLFATKWFNKSNKVGLIHH